MSDGGRQPERRKEAFDKLVMGFDVSDDEWELQDHENLAKVWALLDTRASKLEELLAAERAKQRKCLHWLIVRIRQSESARHAPVKESVAKVGEVG